jgi:hypothetical protein
MRRPRLRPSAALLAATLATAGCASAGRSSVEPPRAPTTVRIATAGGLTTTVGAVSGDGAVKGTIAAPLDSAWRRLPAVYESLRIPLTTIDDSAHYLGNEGLKIRRTLGGQPLMRYLDCGNGSGGPNAETFDVRLAVFTQIHVVSPTQSVASTTLQASARNPSFSGPEMACRSTGLLEQRINELLEQAVFQ